MFYLVSYSNIKISTSQRVDPFFSLFVRRCIYRSIEIVNIELIIQSTNYTRSN
jgi:hypothetical protein